MYAASDDDYMGRLSDIDQLVNGCCFLNINEPSRRSCSHGILECLLTGIDILAICHRLLLVSRRHQEAFDETIAHLSQYLPSSITIPDSLSDDVLLRSRSFLCLSVFQVAADFDVYAECLSSMLFMLRLTAIY
jgi:hypothetical protein